VVLRIEVELEVVEVLLCLVVARPQQLEMMGGNKVKRKRRSKNTQRRMPFVMALDVDSIAFLSYRLSF
jgi:hypothetical protein